MFEGRCRKCGIRFYGWALRYPENQNCPECGERLEILESNGTISEGYSPSVIDRSLFEEIMEILDKKDDNDRENNNN